ncbi:hypothetical protein AGMMS49938_03790 [Fibrobacterales bacterium]|nr:hypothetical protein AGMMS49938_03790 [Fibrobacterales bacterium]
MLNAAKFTISPIAKLAIKLVISAVLVAVILWKFPIAAVVVQLQNAELKWFLLAFLLSEIIILSQAFRWHYLLIVPTETKVISVDSDDLLTSSSEPTKPKFSSLLRYTVVGYFFNLLAPGGVGGDIYRSVALGRTHKILSGSIASVFVAKIFGLVALCLLYFLAYPLLPNDFRIPKYANWFMIFASVFLVAFCAFLIYNPFGDGKFQKLRIYRAYPIRLVSAFIGSIFMQVLVVLMQISIFKAVGISVPFSLVFVIVPITVLLTSIPISFNGIGVREWTMLSLTSFSVNAENMLASLLLGYAMIILQAIQGLAVLHFPTRRRVESRE